MDKSDVRDVMDTASILHVSEIEVFRLAYRDWFGRLAQDKEIDSIFSHYVDRAVVPMWTRAFTRKVQALDKQGHLDTHALGIEIPPAANYWMAIMGGMVFAFMIMIVVLLVYLAAQAQDAASLGCQFPPCY